MAEVTSAFGSNELESLWDFFAKVERLKVLYEFFRRSQSNMVEMSRHYDTTGTVGRATAQVLAGLTFRENVKVQSKEFKTTIEELLHFEPPG